MSLIMKVAVIGQAASVFRFPRTEISVGRVQESDLMLAHASVDERHARVLLRDSRFIVLDLKSTSGTFVNGRRITQPTIIREEDVIRVGAYELGVLLREPASDTERGFLDAIDRNPRDDEMRVVYCDWLEENAHHAEAEFLRAQLSLKGMPTNHPQFQQLSSVIETLAPRMSLSWRRTVARPPIEKCNVRFELSCPKQWDALAPTDDPTRRYCDGCKKNVHYAPTVADARRLAIQGQCVAVDVGLPRSEDDLEHYPVMMAGRIAPPSPLPELPSSEPSR